MEDKEQQSRESQTQILELQKDVEHLNYILKELDKDTNLLNKKSKKII